MELKTIVCLFSFQVFLLHPSQAADSGYACSSTGTSTLPISFDPHLYQICINGTSHQLRCPASYLYITSNADLCTDNFYIGCSTTIEGCAPCEYFPNNPGTATPPPCVGNALLVGQPHCDPSFYWHCSSPYGTPELRSCPEGQGFSSSTRYTGCVPWFMWNS